MCCLSMNTLKFSVYLVQNLLLTRGVNRIACRTHMFTSVWHILENIMQYMYKNKNAQSMARHRESPRFRRNLMIFDLLTPPQGHQFDPRMKFYLYPVLPIIPFNLLCNMTMFGKNLTQAPQVLSLGLDQATEWKNRSIWFIVYLWEHTQSLV